MTVRSTILLLVLGLPTGLLLILGPRDRLDVPPGRTVIRYWEKWSGIEGLAMQRIVDRFNRTVGAEAGGWVQYCAISNVDQRTLVGLLDYIVSQFSGKGALMPLDDAVCPAKDRAPERVLKE